MSCWIWGWIGSTSAEAQGVLTLTPGRSLVDVAGTGQAVDTGDGGSAANAGLASPRGMAYDAAGNLYLADALNHVVREVLVNGTIRTVAGSGVEGFGGDGGPATSALLDTPSGVAIDSSGNLYIADSHNHRVRQVIGGMIQTVAGTGLAGFSGDGGRAASAKLNLPTAVAVDFNGGLYIADTNNQRIRKVAAAAPRSASAALPAPDGVLITTVAGNGEELFAGDGGLATAASLDLPTGIAVDAHGVLYVADRHNQRVRAVDASGTIQTVAGTGIFGYSGDGGGPALAAELAKPSGVWVDAAGSLYVADTGNQRIRELRGVAAGQAQTRSQRPAGNLIGIAAGGSWIETVAGSGEQGYFEENGIAGSFRSAAFRIAFGAASGGTFGTTLGTRSSGGSLRPESAAEGGIGATASWLNEPRSIAGNALGGIVIADTLNERVRLAGLPQLTFPDQGVGISSPAQTLTLANTGNSPLTVDSIAIIGSFVTAAGGSCTAVPMILAAGSECSQKIAFRPASTGVFTGAVVVTGEELAAESVLLGGVASQLPTATALAASTSASLTGEPITFTATVSAKPGESVDVAAGAAEALGNVSFYDGGVLLGKAQSLSGDTASMTVSSLGVGRHSITAGYGGDPYLASSLSSALAEAVSDFNLTITPDPSDPWTSGNQTVKPGAAATYKFNLVAVAGVTDVLVTLSASGLPPGAVAVFTPEQLTLGAMTQSFLMRVQTVAEQSANASGRSRAPVDSARGATTATVAFGILLLPLLPFPPLMRRFRRVAKRVPMQDLRSSGRGRRSGLFWMMLTPLLAAGLLLSLSGCGGRAGRPPESYVIQVSASARTAGGTVLTHVTTVVLTVR